MTEQEWLTSDDPAAMLLNLRAGGSDWSRLNSPLVSDRKLRLFAAACCRAVWDRLTDDMPCPACNGDGRRHIGSGHWDECGCCDYGRVNRSRRAVEVAERFADGAATRVDMGAAWRMADGPNWASRRQEYRVEALPAYVAIESMGWLSGFVDHALHFVPLATQASFLRCIAGNPFKPAPLFYIEGELFFRAGDVSRNFGHAETLIISLARGIYEDRAWDRLFALADALEEAGCPVDDGQCACMTGESLRNRGQPCHHCRGTGRIPNLLLAHLRGDGGPCGTCRGYGKHYPHILRAGGKPGPTEECPDCGGSGRRPALHARGCWVIDTILGRE